MSPPCREESPCAFRLVLADEDSGVEKLVPHGVCLKQWVEQESSGLCGILFPKGYKELKLFLLDEEEEEANNYTEINDDATWPLVLVSEHEEDTNNMPVVCVNTIPPKDFKLFLWELLREGRPDNIAREMDGWSPEVAAAYQKREAGYAELYSESNSDYEKHQADTNELMCWLVEHPLRLYSIERGLFRLFDRPDAPPYNWDVAKEFAQSVRFFLFKLEAYTLRDLPTLVGAIVRFCIVFTDGGGLGAGCSDIVFETLGTALASLIASQPPENVNLVMNHRFGNYAGRKALIHRLLPMRRRNAGPWYDDGCPHITLALSELPLNELQLSSCRADDGNTADAGDAGNIYPNALALLLDYGKGETAQVPINVDRRPTYDPITAQICVRLVSVMPFEKLLEVEFPDGSAMNPFSLIADNSKTSYVIVAESLVRRFVSVLDTLPRRSSGVLDSGTNIVDTNVLGRFERWYRDFCGEFDRPAQKHLQSLLDMFQDVLDAFDRMASSCSNGEDSVKKQDQEQEDGEDDNEEPANDRRRVK